MRLSRDDRASVGLNKAQNLELQSKLDGHPEIHRLWLKRQQYRQRIHELRYRSMESAKRTKLYNKYNTAKHKLNSLTITLRKRKLNQVIHDFHNRIDDDDDINKQLEGNTGTSTLPRFGIHFEFRERAIIGRLLTRPLNELREAQAIKLRIKFIKSLARYCSRQESRNVAIKADVNAGGCVLGEEGHVRMKRKASEEGFGADVEPSHYLSRRRREQSG